MNKASVVIVNFKNNEEIKKIKNEISSNPNIDKFFVINNSPPNKNLGFAAAVNIGIKKALKNGAERILLLNPDIKISNRNINALCKSDGDIVGPVLKFKRGSKTVLDYGGKLNMILGRAKHVEEIFQGDIFGTKENESLFKRHHLHEDKIDYVSGACMLIRREVFEKIGLFDESFFMYFEDVDFCLRATRAGFKLSLETEAVVEHQISEHKFTGDKKKINYNLQSNYFFAQKWLSWPLQILAKVRLALISLHLKLR
jgi:GT2 family glycosyltransferase